MRIARIITSAALVALVAWLAMPEGAVARGRYLRRPWFQPSAAAPASNAVQPSAGAKRGAKAPPVQTYLVQANRILLPTGSTYKRLPSGSVVVYEKSGGGGSTTQVTCKCSGGGTCTTRTVVRGDGQIYAECNANGGCQGCTMTLTTTGPVIVKAFRDAVTNEPVKLTPIKMPLVKVKPAKPAK